MRYELLAYFGRNALASHCTFDTSTKCFLTPCYPIVVLPLADGQLKSQNLRLVLDKKTKCEFALRKLIPAELQ